MTILVNLINSLGVFLSGWFVAPFEGTHPFWPIVFVSLLTAIAMLWIFGKLSNQEAIRIVRQRIRGNLLAVRLYQHDLKIVMYLQKKILVDTFIYLRYSLGPFLVMVIPIVLILAQLQLYFSVQPAQVDESLIIRAVVADPEILQDTIPELVADSDSVRVETPAVRSLEDGEVAWRIKPLRPGRHTITLRIESRGVTKLLVVGEDWTGVPFLRSNSSLDALLYPGEEMIPDGEPFTAVEIGYDPLPILLAGWDFHWLVLFFLLSLLFALLLKKPMGVEI